MPGVRPGGGDPISNRPIGRALARSWNLKAFRPHPEIVGSLAETRNARPHPSPAGAPEDLRRGPLGSGQRRTTAAPEGERNRATSVERSRRVMTTRGSRRSASAETVAFGASTLSCSSTTPRSGSRAHGCGASPQSITLGSPSGGRAPSGRIVSVQLRSPRRMCDAMPRTASGFPAQPTSAAIAPGRSRVLTTQCNRLGPCTRRLRHISSSKPKRRGRVGRGCAGSGASTSRYTSSPSRNRALCVPKPSWVPPGSGLTPRRSSIQSTPSPSRLAATTM